MGEIVNKAGSLSLWVVLKLGTAMSANYDALKSELEWDDALYMMVKDNSEYWAARRAS